ncbi:MAG: preprotein translocase subunit SecY [Chloroflexi bacterium]|nr:preprotein translocase subunit SecY [Chloroflexota bacterium]
MKRSAWRYLWSAQDIRRKLLITFGILVLYRLVAHVPVPGADREAIAGIMNRGGAGANLIALVDMISGGTVQNFSVLAMGVYPYITAQIILQLLGPIVPAFKARMDDDPREYRKWQERWTYYLAIPMAFLQAFGQINIFSNFAEGGQIIPNFGFSGDADILSSFTVLITMTAGTMFAIWLGELISEYGIRNQGLSLIIFAGIISQMPGNFSRMLGTQANPWPVIGFIALITGLMIFVIVYVQQGRRNVPVMYPGRRMGNRMSMPVKGTLPLMVNMAGMIPLIFANAILQFPTVAASFFTDSDIDWVKNLAFNTQALFGGAGAGYFLIYFIFVVGFAFFYTTVLFEQQNYGENLKRVGAQIPGVSRGAPTQRYLGKVLRRITFPGAFFLGLVAVMPFLVTLVVPSMNPTNNPQAGTLLVSSSGLLIVVGVVRDTFFNIDAELKLHGYDESLLVK